jgi:Ca-activated chloride channel family protein
VRRRLTLGAAVGLLATGLAGAGAPQPGSSFRAGIDLVTVAVTVTDGAGALVTGLTAADFTVLEDGRPQTIRYFAGPDAGAAARPELHLGLLLDVSESMADDIAFTRTASIKLFNTLVDAVDVTVVDFDSEIRVARFSRADFPRLVERIRQQKVSGWTALYDALGVYLDGATTQQGRKIVLVYSDGGDTRSALRLPDLLDLLKASDVTVHAIGAPEGQTGRRAPELRLILRQIAETTGGRAYFPLSLDALDRVYTQIAAEVGAEYLLGYLSTNEKADGTWRAISITAASAGRRLRTRARKGYFAVRRPNP